jgi:hypothetical protein
MKKAVAIAVLLIAGCAAHVQHPGTANAFDSDTYDALLVAHSVIESTKSDIGAGSFPANILPGVKVALNGLIDAYNALDIAYCNPQSGTLPSTGIGTIQCSSGSYHAVAMTGAVTPAQNTAIQTQVSNLNNATSALAAAKAGK